MNRPDRFVNAKHPRAPRPRSQPSTHHPPLPLLPPIYLLTCPGREQSLDATLRSLAASDWPDAPRIIRDAGAPLAGEGNPIARGHLALLRAAVEDRAPFFLSLEDDIDLHPQLARRLREWPPLQRGWLHLGTLYNPGLRRFRPSGDDSALPPARWPDGPTWFEADPASILGAQARLFSRECAATILRTWPARGAGQRQDRLIARLAAPLGPIWVHTPSLVQHRGEPSTWSGPAHRALDFSSE